MEERIYAHFPESALDHSQLRENTHIPPPPLSNAHIYPLIYTPTLPNCTWLRHRAVRYVRRVQLGAHMWLKGLNSVKTGSKWAKNTGLSSPNGGGSHLEKHIFHPFFTHFCSQNGPFSRHFWRFAWAKTRHHGLKLG